ncbi:MAG: hypothetical protein F6K26_31780 [Moorea sp. SIO2I5]|nr:hypothetical protein [Moorena sp. SIO2I5]
MNTEGKTDCKQWHTDGWGGYERVNGPEVKHIIGKDQTQQEGANVPELFGSRQVGGIADSNLFGVGLGAN